MGVNPSTIVDEYLDCERRRNNVIAYYLDEPSEQTPIERSKLNSVKLAHLFQTEFCIRDFELSKCICLGKVSQIRPRPVLITISLPMLETLFSGVPLLFESLRILRIFIISPDMTIKEQEETWE